MNAKSPIIPQGHELEAEMMQQSAISASDKTYNIASILKEVCSVRSRMDLFDRNPN